MLYMHDLDLKNKRVVIREDLNVPLKDGVITSHARITAALPTIREALKKGAAVIILSHLGRPTEGVIDESLSLAPVAAELSQQLGRPVPLIKNYLEGVDVQPGQAVLCENVRFNVGEKKNDSALAKKLAALGDVFVMDAFGTAHRAEASTEGALHYAPIACAGPLLAAELKALSQALAHPEKPLLAIVGGSKISTKLALLENITDKADQLMVGGGILNTFILAAGYAVGKSLCEADLVTTAQKIMQKMKARNAEVPLPVDVVVATEFSTNATPITKSISEIFPDEMILDIGPQTAKAWAALIHQAKTIVWNGPVGVFEIPAFAQGTDVLAHAIADSSAFSIAGGGDTLAAIEQSNVSEKISYISTGGGAFLECLEGKELPAVKALG